MFAQQHAAHLSDCQLWGQFKSWPGARTLRKSYLQKQLNFKARVGQMYFSFKKSCLVQGHSTLLVQTKGSQFGSGTIGLLMWCVYISRFHLVNSLLRKRGKGGSYLPLLPVLSEIQGK